MIESPGMVLSGVDGGSWHCMEKEKSALVPKVTKGLCYMRKLRGRKNKDEIME